MTTNTNSQHTTLSQQASHQRSYTCNNVVLGVPIMCTTHSHENPDHMPNPTPSTSTAARTYDVADIGSCGTNTQSVKLRLCESVCANQANAAHLKQLKGLQCIEAYERELLREWRSVECGHNRPCLHRLHVDMGGQGRAKLSAAAQN